LPLSFFPSTFMCIEAAAVYHQTYEETEEKLAELLDCSYLDFDVSLNLYRVNDLFQLVLREELKKHPQEVINWEKRLLAYYADLLSSVLELDESHLPPFEFEKNLKTVTDSWQNIVSMKAIAEKTQANKVVDLISQATTILSPCTTPMVRRARASLDPPPRLSSPRAQLVFDEPKVESEIPKIAVEAKPQPVLPSLETSQMLVIQPLAPEVNPLPPLPEPGTLQPQTKNPETPAETHPVHSEPLLPPKSPKPLPTPPSSRQTPGTTTTPTPSPQSSEDLHHQNKPLPTLPKHEEPDHTHPHPQPSSEHTDQKPTPTPEAPASSTSPREGAHHNYRPSDKLTKSSQAFLSILDKVSPFLTDEMQKTIDLDNVKKTTDD